MMDEDEQQQKLYLLGYVGGEDEWYYQVQNRSRKGVMELEELNAKRDSRPLRPIRNYYSDLD